MTGLVLWLGLEFMKLGHARGITGDDVTNDLNPPHSGDYSLFCIIRTPCTSISNWYDNPRFCDGHRDFLKTITW